MKKTTPKIIKTKERGKNYALWYYFRYFPSNKRLIEKLNIKTEDNNELVQEIYTEIKHLLQEEEIIRTKISNYINKNKNKSYIKNNLGQKLFNQETIERLLTNEFTPESWCILLEHKTINSIQKYKSKNKSKQYIIQKLSESNQDSYFINKLFEQHYTYEEELESCKNEYQKIWTKYSPQKATQKLLSKWFWYDLIKNII